MAKVAIKSEELTPFGGIFSIMELFDSNLSSVIDSTLGMRCRLYGYQYSEIIRSLMSVYFCGSSCIEDVTSHLMCHLSLHKTYAFNTADKLNTLLLNCLLSTGQLKEGEGYDVDFDHQFIETEKYDAKLTYKKFLGYRPGVAVIGDIQPPWREGAHLRRHEQRIRLELASKILHGREHGISSAYGTHTKLL